MSLLDDARRLAGQAPLVAEGKIAMGAVCAVCWTENGHDDDCPWLAMPKIVAALEAAEALRAELVGLSGDLPPYRSGNPSLHHLYDETVDAFVSALCGEEVTDGAR